MKSSLTLILATGLVFIAAPVFAHMVNPAKLKINGSVGLDSTYAQVVRLLGKPVREASLKTKNARAGTKRP